MAEWWHGGKKTHILKDGIAEWQTGRLAETFLPNPKRQNGGIAEKNPNPKRWNDRKSPEILKD